MRAGSRVNRRLSEPPDKMPAPPNPAKAVFSVI